MCLPIRSTGSSLLLTAILPYGGYTDRVGPCVLSSTWTAADRFDEKRYLYCLERSFGTDIRLKH